MPSIAERTRRAVDRTPHLRRALREGILNYTAAARALDVSADVEAVASALRRYEAELPAPAESDRSVRVRMERSPDPTLLSVADRRPSTSDSTAIRLTGAPDAALLARALSAFEAASVTVRGAGFLEEEAVILVPSRDGSDALRLAEAALPE